MYFLKNEVKGAECLCSSTYDSKEPNQRYDIKMDPLVESFRRAKQPSSYFKQPVNQPLKKPANTCNIQPASDNRGMVVPMLPRSRLRHRGFARPAMTMEPVSKVRAVYEDTENSRPFDFAVDYGNAYAGYTDTTSQPQTQPTLSTDDIFFNFNTIDQTSPQYLEALRSFYDKLGFPNFSPKNGYEAPVELFQPPQTSYAKISKF